MSGHDETISGVRREILDILERSKRLKPGGLWLNPAAVARNLGRSNNYINTQMRELYQDDLLESDGDGYYRIAPDGSDRIRER